VEETFCQRQLLSEGCGRQDKQLYSIRGMVLLLLNLNVKRQKVQAPARYLIPGRAVDRDID
jgi:hypothetical protein